MSKIRVDQLENLTTGEVWEVGKASYEVANIPELINTPILSGNKTVFVGGYHTKGDGGGGYFYWDATKDKTEHNGGTVIDPTVVFPTDWNDQTQLSTWFDTANAGTGCWVRQYDGAVNIKWFGAKGDGEIDDTDDTKAIQSAIDSLDTGIIDITGGIIHFDVGKYIVNSPIILRSSNTEYLGSITLSGSGMQNTVILAGSLFSGTEVLRLSESTYCKIENITINADNKASYGIHTISQKSGGQVYSELKFMNVYCRDAIDSCFFLERGFLITLDQCRTRAGLFGFNFDGFHTSVHVTNCYAINALNSGYRINDMVYSSFINCASDNNVHFGYLVNKCIGVVFDSCGAEFCGRSSFGFIASSAQDSELNGVTSGINAVLNNCFSNDCARLEGSYGGSIYSEQVDTSSIYVKVFNFYEVSTASSFSVVSSGTKNKLDIESSRFAKANFSNAAISKEVVSNRFNNISVTGPNTIICSLRNIFGTVGQYSGIMHIQATNNNPNIDGPANTSGYALLITKSTAGSSVLLLGSNGLVSGGGASHPSFTFSIDVTNNKLLATPIGDTSGIFSFYISSIGMINTI